jgi:hypothetical protein
MDASQIDFRFTNLLIPVYPPFYAHGLVNRLIYAGVDFGVKKCAPSLLIPKDAWTKRAEAQRHPLDLGTGIPRTHSKRTSKYILEMNRLTNVYVRLVF